MLSVGMRLSLACYLQMMCGSIRCVWHKEEFRCIDEWYEEWGVKINLAKPGIVHICKKKAEQCEVVYEVEGEAIPMVLSYKYLGCVVDEYLELTEIVGDKAESERRALGACLQRCQTDIRDVGVDIFQKLMGSLVESGMMYWVEIWSCSRHGSMGKEYG